jgi:hypothetical protein
MNKYGIGGDKTSSISSSKGIADFNNHMLSSAFG